MGFDLVAFSEATPGTGTVPVAVALNETLYGKSGDELQISKKAPYLLGVYFGALTTPNNLILRQPRQIDFASCKSVLNTEFNPEAGFMNLMQSPKALVPDEKLTAYSVNATDELTLAGLMLGNGKLGKPDRVDLVIRGVVDQALTAHTWTSGDVVWDQDLPKGVYDIVGMLAGTYKLATPEFALSILVIPNYSAWRPGVPMHGLQFDSRNMPNVEMCGTVVQTDAVIQLALQKSGK